MAKFIIKGGYPLKGSVRIGGAKNAGFKQMIASLLITGQTRLLNLSQIGDVVTTAEIMRQLGAEVESRGERSVFINADSLNSFRISAKFGKVSRCAPLFVGPLLARFGRVIFPLPGGDLLGPRPIDRSLAGWEAFGATIKKHGQMVEIVCPKLTGTVYSFAKPTHTGTEAMIMTAVLAQGTTVLKNTALEPEVDDLISFLNKSGAKIKRGYSREIKIEGVKSLKGIIYAVMPDRNEAISYACVALATRGDIIVENAREKDIRVFMEKVKEIGGRWETDGFGIRFWYDKPLKATDLVTAAYPGFATDWQPLWTLLMTQAKGRSKVIEAVQCFRFHYANDINRMGGKINLFNPKVANPEKFYEFNLSSDRPEYYHGAYIDGPTPLKAINTTFSDIRAGATMTIAALIARGTSVLEKAEMVDRGYENLDGRLKELGARIKRE